MKLLKDK